MRKLLRNALLLRQPGHDGCHWRLVRQCPSAITLADKPPVAPVSTSASRSIYNGTLARTAVFAVLLLLTATNGVHAADSETDTAPAVITEPATNSQPPTRSASQEVHEGNRLLLDGLANEALEAYQRAGQQRPDAPEIPFVKGLAHFALEEYEPAREEFLKASSADDSALADDALYGLGACDHAEALKLSEQPEQAIERLESAMQRYKSVLADRPDHQAARDAIYKAGSLRRQLKQQMEEQQQQQQSDDKDKENEDDENESDEQQEKSDGEQSDEEKEQQQQDQSEQDQEEQDQENQQQSESDDQQQEQEQQESESEEQSEAEQREQNSREQADRQLREMMQSMRERTRDRKKPQKLIPISPVEKDW